MGSFLGTFGLPGGLGQPSGGPGRNAQQPLSGGGSADVSPFGPGNGNPGLVNLTGHDYLNINAESGSFAIPPTTPGNLIVVLVAGQGEPPAGNPFFLSIGSNVDLFTQVPFYLLPNDGYTLGQMFTFTDGITTSSMAQLDCWYAVSAGGTSQINWTCPKSGVNTLQGFFWVFELSGVSNWGLLDYRAAGNLTVQSQPYFGPVLNSSVSGAYFTLVTSSGGLNFGSAEVNGPWTLDPNGSLNCLGYLFDQSTTGAKQVAVKASFDPSDIYQSIGVVFGFVPPGGGGGSPPPPDTEEFLPNVWIVS